MARFINPAPQYFLNDGTPNVGGKVQFFQSGTSLALNTYVESTFDNLNTNPMILDAAGRIGNCFFEGSAKVTVRDANDVLISEDDPVGGEQTTGEFSAWGSLITYPINSIVIGGDGKFYISLQNTNISNNPTTPSPTWWTEIRFVPVFNTNQIYSTGTIVQTTDGVLWASQIDNNIGNAPSTDSGSNWVEINNINFYNATISYSIGDVALTTDGFLWTSQTNSNLANTPLTDDGTNWLKTNLPVEGVTSTAISHYYRNR